MIKTLNMKILIKILIFLSIIMILFNAFQVNWESPMEGQSSVAVIGIMASLCALLLLIILMISMKISNKLKRK